MQIFPQELQVIAARAVSSGIRRARQEANYNESQHKTVNIPKLIEIRNERSITK